MPWSSLQGVVDTSRLHFAAAVFARVKKKNYISVMYCALFPTFQLSFCLAHLLNFIYLLMWHFCYTEHVSFIYIYIDYVYVFLFFLKPFHYIIFILFYMIIIIISVAVALAAMFSLSDSLLTIAFSYICIVLTIVVWSNKYVPSYLPTL